MKHLPLILLALTATPAIAQQPPRPKEQPYSCQLYYEAQRKCSYNTVGPCYVQHEVNRLRQQCIREGGRV
jgi:hypothetical protein